MPQEAQLAAQREATAQTAAHKAAVMKATPAYPRPETRNPKPETRNPKLSYLNPKP
jgi:hypothetical protein